MMANKNNEEEMANKNNEEEKTIYAFSDESGPDKSTKKNMDDTLVSTLFISSEKYIEVLEKYLKWYTKIFNNEEIKKILEKHGVHANEIYHKLKKKPNIWSYFIKSFFDFLVECKELFFIISSKTESKYGSNEKYLERHIYNLNSITDKRMFEKWNIQKNDKKCCILNVDTKNFVKQKNKKIFLEIYIETLKKFSKTRDWDEKWDGGKQITLVYSKNPLMTLADIWVYLHKLDNEKKINDCDEVMMDKNIKKLDWGSKDFLFKK